MDRIGSQYWVRVIISLLLLNCLSSCSRLDRFLGGKDEPQVSTHNSPSPESEPSTMGVLVPGVNGNVFLVSPDPKPSNVPTQITTGELVIEQIEISRDLITWIPLLSAPRTIVAHDYGGVVAPFSKVGSELNVPVGEYIGARIRFANGPPVILETNTGIIPTNLDPIPEITYFNGGGGYTAVQPYAELTVPNNFLSPFTVRADQKTYLSFYVTFMQYMHGPNNTVWALLVGAKGLSIQP